MKTRKVWRAVIALSCALPLAALAAEPPTPDPHAASAAKTAPAEARIAFANHHGIYTWDVLNDRTMLIQSQTRQWYKATLMSPCFELPFVETMGFETNPDGSFDKFSAVKVRGQRCPLISLVESPPPAKKVKKHDFKIAPAATTHAPDEAAAK